MRSGRKGRRNCLFNMPVFSLTVLFMLAILSIFTAGCLDATGKNEKLETNYRDRIDKRIFVTSENFQNNPQKTSQIKDVLLKNVKIKKAWESAFDAMQHDEEITDRLRRHEIISDKSYLRLASMSKITKMGHQSFDLLLNSSEHAKNENDLEYILDGIVSVMMKNVPDINTNEKLSTFLIELVQKYSGDLHEKALKIWAEIAHEIDFPLLAKYLETDNGITRMLIYSKLRTASDNEVLVEIAKHLESQKMSTRVYAVNLLRQLTGKYFDYNPGGELISRQITTLRWQLFIFNNQKYRNSVSR